MAWDSTKYPEGALTDAENAVVAGKMLTPQQHGVLKQDNDALTVRATAEFNAKKRQNVGDSRTDVFNDGVVSSREANGGLDPAANRGVTGSGSSLYAGTSHDESSPSSNDPDYKYGQGGPMWPKGGQGRV